MRFYFETSVLGALTDWPDELRVATTRRLLGAVRDRIHEAVISNVVQEELEQAPGRVREVILREIRDLEFALVVEDQESARLFAEYLTMRVLSPRFRNDLRHVAVATVARVDALVSWNFRHLVNLRTRRAVHAANLRLGYPLIEIVSPEEV